MATLKDVAKDSGVSVSTVSRLLKGDKTLNVSSSTREQVFESAKKLNYTTKSKSVNGIEIAVINWYSHDQEVIDPYYFYIRKGISNTCKELNVKYTTFFKEDDISTLLEFDAIIAVGKFSSKEVDYLFNTHKYVIFVDSNPDPHIFDSVEVDFEALIEDVFNQIEENKTVGLLNGCEYLNGEKFEDPRLKAYYRQCKLLDIDPIVKEGEFTMESGYNMVNELDVIPDVLICGNDLIALGVNKALNDSDVLVGVDTKIIGINNIPVSKYITPSLSTVRIDQNSMGEEAVKMVLRNLQDPTNNRVRLLLPTKLIRRDSF